MNIFAISGLLIVGITSVAEILLMFAKDKNKLHYLWGIFGASVILWGFGGYKVATTTDSENALFWWRIAYIGVIFITILFTHFVHEFLNISKRWLIIVIYLLGFFFLITNFINGFFINKVRWTFDQFYYLSSPPLLYTLFVIFFFGLIIYSYIKLLQAYKITSSIVRTQIKYIFLATLIGFSGGAFAFLPVYKIDLYPILNITIAFASIIITYALVKKELFGIKVVLTTLFVGLIAFLLLIDALVFTERLAFRIVKGGVLVAFLFFGYLLVRSVLKEIRYREEIQRAYKVEQEARKKIQELGEAKTQFIMATQHHLRTPLTSMQGYLDLIFGGSYGKISPEVKETLLKLQTSTRRLIRIVNELLDISQFQLGKKVVSLKPDINIEPILKEVVEELQFTAKAKGIYLNLEKPKEKIPLIKADTEKFKVALFNIFDNGIKYTSKGGITIKYQVVNDKLLISSKDTGIGITEADKKTLFRGIFERGKEAQKVFTSGRGIGLYIAAQIIKAHQGKIWAESEGEGKGSTFFVELPVG